MGGTRDSLDRNGHNGAGIRRPRERLRDQEERRLLVSAFEFRVSGLEFRVQGLGIRVSDFDFRVLSLGFRGAGFEFRV